jgi:hypothetical protein
MPFVRACRAAQKKHGEDFTYLPATGGQVPFRAVFETAYQEVDVDTGVAVLSTQPRLTYVVYADITGGADRSGRIVARGETFRLRDKPNVDEDGVCDLYLHKV